MSKLPAQVSLLNTQLPPPASWEIHHPLLRPHPGCQCWNTQGSVMCLVTWEQSRSHIPTLLFNKATSPRVAVTPLSAKAAPICQSTSDSLAPGKPTEGAMRSWPFTI